MRAPLSRITLGTAQLGMHYGIVNDGGCPSDAEVSSILAVAQQAGFDSIDTARAYGNAESRLGVLLPARQRWRITTKVAPLRDFMAANGIIEPCAAVAESVRQSLGALGVDSIDVVMFHRPEDVALGLEALQAECDAGRIREMGVSVYTPEQAMTCLEDARIRHLQIPFNLLDSRWLRDGFVGMIQSRPDVTVHARSAFLQGLLLSPASRWPAWVENVDAILRAVDQVVNEVGCLNRLELCLRYNASIPWITTTVIGVDRASQLQEVAAAAAGGPFDAVSLSHIERIAALATPRLIDPSAW